MCVLECIRLCVCVVERGRGTGLRVEGRGLELRVEVESRGSGLRVGVEGWRMHELESEYEITRRRYSSSLLVVVTRVT